MSTDKIKNQYQYRIARLLLLLDYIYIYYYYKCHSSHANYIGPTDRSIIAVM